MIPSGFTSRAKATFAALRNSQRQHQHEEAPVLTEAMKSELEYHAAEPCEWAFKSSRWRLPKSVGTARLLKNIGLLESRTFSELAQRGKRARIRWTSFAVTEIGKEALARCKENDDG